MREKSKKTKKQLLLDIKYLQDQIKTAKVSSKGNEADKALQESELKYRSLVDNIDLGIFRTSGDQFGDFIHANPAIVEMFGYQTVEKLMEASVEELYANQGDRKELLLEMKNIGYVTDKELRFKKKNGQLFWGRLNATPSFDKDGEIQWLDGVLEDITEKKKLEDQLIHRVFHDELTELPNRALFMDRLERAINRGKRDKDFIYAVLFVDLDRFKVVNDSLGHDIGDKVLYNVSRILETCVREIDTVARFAGDEFIILLEDIRGIEDAMLIADRIKKILRQPQEVGENRMVVTGTIGITIKKAGKENAEDIVRDADIAMYRAKVSGKNRYEVFDTAMLSHTIERLENENDLRYCIENQFICVHYQPIVNLISNELIGFEALVRWNHPDKGIILPEEFLDLAEEIGLIIDVGKIVINEACQSLKDWSDKYECASNLTMSVNLSGRQLLEPNLVDDITSIIKETELDPNRLKIEITEENVIWDIEKSIKILKKLKDFGIDAHIDDFGKGYSSLSMLHQLPIKTVKIDRSFINPIEDGGKNIGFARTIIMLADDLGMDVIAEGIERKEHINELLKVGCKLGQGYYFSKPVTEQEVEKMIEKDCVGGI